MPPIDEFNRPAKSEYGTPRIPPAEAEVDQLFAGWRGSLGQARKFLPAARDYMVASLWRRVGTRMTETLKLDIRDWRPDLGGYGRRPAAMATAHAPEDPGCRAGVGAGGVGMFLRCGSGQAGV
ncbi:hypothetical protein JK364_51070 [Streptomyces sp. 110]|uniref:Uncharacterized protein n=1 Tax=Streptomyces endocoffeicus TaxID=2898945 RepID=A0ABS1Q7C2_9ACTN|nr:hypothetical protein [Streptomyces endocoffeicus]MBL1120578.1 hypothetical protein [Streptomyces endocoffeicus]